MALTTMPSRKGADPAVIAEVLRRLALADAPSMPGRTVPSPNIGEPPPAPVEWNPAIRGMEAVSADLDRMNYPARNVPFSDFPSTRTMAPMDSTVVGPEALKTADAPGRPMRDPAAAMGDVPRKADESDAEYAARKHRVFTETLKTGSPYSKIRETPTGVYEAPPMKPGGFKGRGGAGFRMAGRTLSAGQPYGIGGMAGAGLVGLLTGIFAPGFEAKVGRQEEIAKADQEANADAKRVAQEQEAKLREAQVTDALGLPGRRADAAKEQERDNLLASWNRIVQSGLAFDKNNPDHVKLQQRAAELGVFLPFTPPKPVSAKAGAGPKQGLANATTVADADGNKIYVDKTTLKPIPDPADPSGNTPLYADRAKPDLPDTSGENKNIELEAERAKAQRLAKESEAEAKRVGAEAVRVEAELKNAQAEVDKIPDSTTESTMSVKQKNALERVKDLRTKLSKLREDESTAWSKRAEYDIASESVPTLKTKPGRGKSSTGAYAGQTFQMSWISEWATSGSPDAVAGRRAAFGSPDPVSPAAARAVFEKQGAKILR